jgi:glycosyltransferase involved in cell wall biosynthesis
MLTVTVGIPTYNRSRLLRDSIESVLAQTHSDVTLLVSDNASTDETADVVASFSDTRIRYARADANIGMIANFNRIIALTETDALLILPDDDLLHPDHLSTALGVLEAEAGVGLVHTGFDQIDDRSRVTEREVRLMDADAPVVVETGRQYLARSMQSGWTVCFPSALYRTQAIVDAGCFREDDLPLADVPLLMRVAAAWDFAFVRETLASTRMHGGSVTSALGSFTGTGYELDQLPEILHGHRMRFLAEAGLPQDVTASYRRLAASTYRREAVKRLADAAGGSGRWSWTNRQLARLVREDPAVLLEPRAWRLVAAQLGGRRVRSGVGRLSGRRSGPAAGDAP